VERKKGRLGLGRVEEIERGKRKRKREWAGPKEIKGKKKNCIQMHLNLKFKSKSKKNNKTMQCGMKCTKPIFPYIPFYG
jgi:hypothetical protein